MFCAMTVSVLLIYSAWWFFHNQVFSQYEVFHVQNTALRKGNICSRFVFGYNFASLFRLCLLDRSSVGGNQRGDAGWQAQIISHHHRLSEADNRATWLRGPCAFSGATLNPGLYVWSARAAFRYHRLTSRGINTWCCHTDRWTSQRVLMTTWFNTLTTQNQALCDITLTPLADDIYFLESEESKKCNFTVRTDRQMDQYNRQVDSYSPRWTELVSQSLSGFQLEQDLGVSLTVGK